MWASTCPVEVVAVMRSRLEALVTFSHTLPVEVLRLVRLIVEAVDWASKRTLPVDVVKLKLLLRF